MTHAAAKTNQALYIDESIAMSLDGDVLLLLMVMCYFMPLVLRSMISCIGLTVPQ